MEADPQAGEPERLMGYFYLGPKAWEWGLQGAVGGWAWGRKSRVSRKLNNQELQYLRAGKDKCLSSGWESKFTLSLPFYSIQTLSGLNGARLIGGLLIQMLISSRDTLTDALRNNVLPAIWASLSQIKLIKITILEGWSNSRKLSCTLPKHIPVGQRFNQPEIQASTLMK